MPRELKMHLLRPNNNDHLGKSLGWTACGIITESSTKDPEAVTCKHCSGFYRTNLEWYSQVKNRAVEGRGQTGDGDLYTRSDLEAGLARMGWSMAAIKSILDNTPIFRSGIMPVESPDPWVMVSKMGLRISPGGPKR